MIQSKKLLACSLLIIRLLSSSLICRGFNDYANKTYLATRPIGVDTAREYTLWHGHAYKKNSKHIHSHISVTPFYQNSQNGDVLGRYFGIGNGSNSFKIGSAADVTAGVADLDKGLFIHDSTNTANDFLKGTITLKPVQEIWGTTISWFQDLNSPRKGLFFKASMPIAYVANNVGLNITDSAPTGLFRNPNKQYSLKDFFAGNVLVNDGIDKQTGLTKAKIDGKRSQTGIADIDLGIGYKYYCKDQKHVFFSIDLTIPTGNRPSGEYLWEPICGNGGHVGLGASLDTGMELWANDTSTITLLWATRYKYLFQKSEQRTLGVKNQPFGQYMLAAAPSANTGITLTPVANSTTQGVFVKPGNLIDSSIIFSFKSNGFTIDAGYSLFCKDQESVHKKSNDFSSIAIAPTNLNLVLTALTATNAVNVITNDGLSVDSSKTGTLFTHKVNAGLGYTGTVYKKYPCSIGFGSSYTFATSNADIENYSIFGKCIVSF